jgi:hypothetical protein
MGMTLLVDDSMDLYPAFEGEQMKRVIGAVIFGRMVVGALLALSISCSTDTNDTNNATPDDASNGRVALPSSPAASPTTPPR